MLSIFIPALLLRVAFDSKLKSKKKNLIGRFNDRFQSFIDGFENWKAEPYYLHTKDICTSKHLRDTTKSCINEVCFNPKNLFKFHSRLIAIFFNAIVVIFLILISNILLTGPAILETITWVQQQWELYTPIVVLLEVLLTASNETDFNQLDPSRIKTSIDIFSEYLNVAKLSVYLGFSCAAVLTVFNMYRMFLNYRNHCSQVIRANYTEVHKDGRTNVSLMTGNLKYQAYQTAYIGVGFVLQIGLFTFVFLLLGWGLILPIILPIDFIKDWLIQQIISIAPSLGYLFAIVILQHVLCRFIIMQNHNLDTAIDNRRVYNLAAYFFFFNVNRELRRQRALRSPDVA